MHKENSDILNKEANIEANNAVKKDKGQIAIFLALIFVVLFTLFGLTINISMVVHDKINLQNATDLSSYYVAQRQAEILNAIAHTNYQIRQAWKLFAFRYRVIGTIGRKGNLNSNPRHPGLKYPAEMGPLRLDETVYSDADFGGICAAAPHFFSIFPESDYLCRVPVVDVPFITPGSYTFGGIGGAGVISGNIKNVNTTITASCEAQTYFNWWFANIAYNSFKNDQKARRAVIRALAENLARPIARGGMKDLDGNDVYTGALNTFRYNLSESNRETGDANDNYRLVFKNSLEGISRDQWLPEITVDVTLPYNTFGPSGGSGCTNQGLRIANLEDPPSVGEEFSIQFRQALDPEELLPAILNYSADLNSLESLSVGVEKNPWVMIYNKVESSVFSKPLFSPDIEEGADGQRGIRIWATSYAKPFGGRIGPWYNKAWSKGASRSDGGNKNDALYPQRATGSLGAINPNDRTLRPNYSRFPSDQKGLTTNSSMVALGRLIDWPVRDGAPLVTGDELINTVYSFFDATPLADPLSQNPPPEGPSDLPAHESFLRDLEIAAVVPDAFDVTYYSIFPGFWDNFGSKLSQWLQPSNGLGANFGIRGDLGFIAGGDGELSNFDIINQIENSHQVNLNYAAPGGPPYDRLLAPWFLKRTANSTNVHAYLSGWNSGLDVMDYTGPTNLAQRFAGCDSNRDISVGSSGANVVRTPGECLSGGRVGYSVKLISADYLNSSHPSLGGSGNDGEIINPDEN